MSDRTRRDIKDGPFCWQGKEVLRRIGEHFAESGKVASARSVYVGLAELASNEKNARFQVKIDTLAKFAGVSGRTVREIIPEFELIGVVQVERQSIAGSKLKAPSFYTLLQIGNKLPTIGTNFPSIGNGPEHASVAENQKNNENNTEKKDREETLSSPSAQSFKVSQAVVDSIYREYPRKKQPSTAHRAIRKALGILDKRGTPDPAAWLTDRVQVYATSRANEDPQFTPYPASWFNAGSYDEDFSATTKPNGHAHYRGQPPAKATTRYDF